MNERAKIMATHLSRQAIVYLRQSSAAQVENNREFCRNRGHHDFGRVQMG